MCGTGQVPCRWDNDTLVFAKACSQRWETYRWSTELILLQLLLLLPPKIYWAIITCQTLSLSHFYINSFNPRNNSIEGRHHDYLHFKNKETEAMLDHSLLHTLSSISVLHFRQIQVCKLIYLLKIVLLVKIDFGKPSLHG